MARVRRHAILCMAVNGVLTSWSFTPCFTPLMIPNRYKGLPMFVAYAVVTPCVDGVTADRVFFMGSRRRLLGRCRGSVRGVVGVVFVRRGRSCG